MAAARSSGHGRRRLDLASILALPVGIIVVLVGQAIEGGAMRSLLQGAAALIVFGGTLGAVLISFSPAEVWRAVRAAAATFTAADDDATSVTARLVGLSIIAHRKGLLALDSEIDTIEDPFLRTGLTLAVDDTSSETLREMLGLEMAMRAADDDAPARVFDAAAGYAPTLGILGAVLGLIQVMEHLTAPGSLGSGIAVAFVATVYGVGSANLIFLPIAGRLRERGQLAARRRELVAEGIAAIGQQQHPRMVAQKLRAFAGTGLRVDDVAARLSTKPSEAIRVPA
ncbi:MAG TPA: flagellar motor protein [Vicinamibacterales bacterium]|nr:flagellar motor protein [Vicinamibacterales bacterium]